MSNNYESSDYAGIDSKNISFYYGYEEIDEDDNWLFIATRNHEVIESWTAEDLGIDKSFEVTNVLMAGIARFFDTWYVSDE